MRDRGINNPDELLAFASPAVILLTCRWWDGKRDAGPGLLAKAIRDGGVTAPAPDTRSLADQQRDYCDSIVVWLTEHFPDLCDPRWGPHPGTIAAVIALHDRYGKGSLTAERHGAQIRAAVTRFDRIGELSPADEARAERRRRERLGITTPPPTLRAVPERPSR